MTFIEGIIEMVSFPQCKTVSSNLYQFQFNVLTMNSVAHLVTNAHQCTLYVTMTMTASMEVMRMVATLLNALLTNICAHRVTNAIASRTNATVKPTAPMEVTRLIAGDRKLGRYEKHANPK